MNKITSAVELRTAILHLENQLKAEGGALKSSFRLAYESIQPINLIKNTLREAMHSQEISNNIMNIGASLTAGYFTKTMFSRMSNSPIKKLLTTIAVYGVFRFIARHPEAIKSIGNAFFNLFRSKQSDN